MNDISQYVGIGAGIFTAATLLPQLVKIIKEKSGGNFLCDVRHFAGGTERLGLVWDIEIRLANHYHQLFFHADQYPDHYFFGEIQKGLSQY